MLTKKQNELLIFIQQNIRETGIAPSYEEMKEALDLRSKSGIDSLINVDLSFLFIICFIASIAGLVQFVEMFIDKFKY